jgi:hypothetical protein
MSEASVTAQIAIIQGYADDAITAAESAITSLQDMDFPYVSIGPIPYDPPEWPDVVVPSIPSEVSIGSAPAVIDVTSPTLPTKPDLKTFDDPTMITPVIPSAPEKETPVWEDVDLGELLEAEIPTAPTVNIDLISLDVTIPKLNILAPTNWTFELDPNILISDDPMIQVALLRLKNNILYGGTGLSADVESAIWNRDIERNEQQLRDSMDKVSSAWAKKGFSLPDGLLANSISAIQLEYFNRNIDRSREIAIKQAELEQSNIFKSLELCVNLSTKLIDETIRYATLSLQCQEDIAKFSNEYIELQIKTYNSMLDEYKSRVQVYQALISANQAKISMYREQIAAELARLSINDQTIKVFSERNQVAIAKYRGKLDGNQISATIFNTEMQGVNIQEEINSTRVKRYAEMIQAEMAKIERYKVEVQAMEAELNTQRARVETNKLQIEAWQTAAQVKLEQFKGLVEVYSSTSRTNVSVADLQARQTEAELRSNLSATELSLKAAELNGRSLQTSSQLRLEAMKAISASAASRAAGAMAAASAQSSNSYGESKQL